MLWSRFINIGTLPKFCYETKVKWIIKLMARLINLLQKVLQQTDSISKEFQQGGIYVALSLALSIFIYLTLSFFSLYLQISLCLSLICYVLQLHSKKNLACFMMLMIIPHRNPRAILVLLPHNQGVDDWVEKDCPFEHLKLCCEMRNLINFYFTLSVTRDWPYVAVIWVER